MVSAEDQTRRRKRRMVFAMDKEKNSGWGGK